MPKYLDEPGLTRFYDNIADRPVHTFDTVAEMQAATYLKAGMTCHTNGFHASGDGGAAHYTVGTSGTANGMDVLALQGGLFATLATGLDNPACYGADTSGSADSTAQINACIASSDVVTFAAGTYRVDGTLSVTKRTDIDLNGATIVNSTSVATLIDISYTNSKTSEMHVKNGYIDSSASYVISVTTAYNVKLENLCIVCDGGGIQINRGSTPADAYIANVLITNRDMSQDCVGMFLGRSDCKVVDCRIAGFKVGIDHNQQQHYIENVHFLADYIQNVTTIDGNYVANNNCISGVFVGCYCDSYGVFLKGTTFTGTISDIVFHNYSNKIGTAALVQVEQDIKLLMDGTYDNTSYHDNDLIALSTNERFLNTINLCKVKMVYNARYNNWVNCLSKEIAYQNIFNNNVEADKWVELGLLLCLSPNILTSITVIHEGVVARLSIAVNSNLIYKDSSSILPNVRFGYSVDADHPNLLHLYMKNVSSAFKPTCQVMSTVWPYAPFNTNGYRSNNFPTTTAPDVVTSN